MKKMVSIETAISKIKDGDTILIGGFLSGGGPNKIINYIVENTDLKDLTIVANDTSYTDKGLGKLVVEKRVKKFIGTHIGTNPETQRQMNEGEIEVELIPQGTFIEKIRAGGFGLGGILTGTGVGIEEIEKGKQIINVEGKDYLLERPIRGDVALIHGSMVDKYGNIVHLGSTNNFNNCMTYAADTVIVEADEIVDIGELDPGRVNTPGIVVDYIVDGGNLNG